MAPGQALETKKALRVARDLRKSAALSERADRERAEYKKQLEDETERKFKSRELRKKEMLLKWSKKLDRSSFLVDQVAESERIDEEHRVKLEEEAKRARMFEERKQRIKTEIILKALAETNDLDQLRQEKRLIIEEERRLKVAAGQAKQKDCIAEKEDKMKASAEERRRRNEQQLMQQKNRCVHAADLVFLMCRALVVRDLLTRAIRRQACYTTSGRGAAARGHPHEDADEVWRHGPGRAQSIGG